MFEAGQGCQLRWAAASGTIYLSGSLSIKGTNLCAASPGTSCDWNMPGSGQWNPSTNALVLVTNATGGQTNVAAGMGVSLSSAGFQGFLFANNGATNIADTSISPEFVSGSERGDRSKRDDV